MQDLGRRQAPPPLPTPVSGEDHSSVVSDPETFPARETPPCILDSYGNVTSDLKKGKMVWLDGAGRQAGGGNVGWSQERGEEKGRL